MGVTYQCVVAKVTRLGAKFESVQGMYTYSVINIIKFTNLKSYVYNIIVKTVMLAW